MATIRRRGTTWVLEWREGGKRFRKSLGSATKREAEQLVKLKLEELQRARYANVVALPAPASAMPTVQAFIEKTYLPWRASEYPDTQESEEGRWRRVLLPEFGNLQLDRVTMTRVEDWKGRRLRQTYRGAPIKPATVTKELRSLLAALNRAHTLRLIQSNPASGVRAPRDMRSVPPEWYTAADLERLYAQSQHRPGDEQVRGLPPNGWADWAPVWRLYANTGMRRTEGLQLRWAHVTRGELRILSDEGARTKSGKWRAVPLSEGAAAALELLRPLTEASGFVLPQVHPDAITAAFRRHAERANLPGHLHCLRHTFCANLVSAGVPLRTVQVLAGHASITTTERYAHLAPDHIANAVRFLRL